MGFKNLKLKKQGYFGIELENNIDPKKTAKALIESGELVNLAKEIPTITMGEKSYKYEKGNGLVEKDIKIGSFNEYLTFNKEDTDGESTLQTIKTHFSIPGITKISSGKKWILDIEQDKADEVVKTQIFHNPHAMNIYKV